MRELCYTLRCGLDSGTLLYVQSVRINPFRFVELCLASDDGYSLGLSNFVLCFIQFETLALCSVAQYVSVLVTLRFTSDDCQAS